MMSSMWRRKRKLKKLHGNRNPPPSGCFRWSKPFHSHYSRFFFCFFGGVGVGLCRNFCVCSHIYPCLHRKDWSRSRSRSHSSTSRTSTTTSPTSTTSTSIMFALAFMLEFFERIVVVGTGTNYYW